MTKRRRKLYKSLSDGKREKRMNIQEVSEILGVCYFLRAPKHVFITQEQVWSREDGVTHYRGLQPKSKGNSIFLSAQADLSTPIHETVHTYGVNEFGTEILTRLIMRKNEVLKKFPFLRELTKKKLVYRKVEGSREYPQAHGERYRRRLEHFVLAEDKNFK